LYIYNILNNPFHIYAMRRYVPVVLPTFVLAGGVFLAWLWERRHYARIMRTIAVLGFVAWMTGLLVNGRLIWTHAEYAGITQQIESTAARFPQNAILLFVDPAPVGLGVVVGTPLHFLHDLHPMIFRKSIYLSPCCSHRSMRGKRRAMRPTCWPHPALNCR
jgi:hypothetical protein